MNIVDRYLLAVRAFLPRATQEDIIKELSEDIRSRIEDREEAVGRPLTAAEQESLVKELGHPALLAGRYGPRRRLIGPELFPFYWLVLKLALGVGVAVHLAIAIAMFSGGHPGQALRQATVVLPLVAFVQFGVITIVFAALDFYGVLSRFNIGWNPRALPAAPRRRQPLVHLVLSMLVAAWWLIALRQPAMIFGPHASVVRLAPIWQSLYLPILLLTLSDVALRIVDLVRPQWTRARSLARVAISGLALAILYVLMRAGEWVVIVDAANASSAMRGVVEVFNQAFPWGFGFVAIGFVVTMLVQLWTFRAGRHDVTQTT